MAKHSKCRLRVYEGNTCHSNLDCSNMTSYKHLSIISTHFSSFRSSLSICKISKQSNLMHASYPCVMHVFCIYSLTQTILWSRQLFTSQQQATSNYVMVSIMSDEIRMLKNCNDNGNTKVVHSGVANCAVAYCEVGGKLKLYINY